MRLEGCTRKPCALKVASAASRWSQRGARVAASTRKPDPGDTNHPLASAKSADLGRGTWRLHLRLQRLDCSFDAVAPLCEFFQLKLVTQVFGRVQIMRALCCARVEPFKDGFQFLDHILDCGLSRQMLRPEIPVIHFTHSFPSGEIPRSFATNLRSAGTFPDRSSVKSYSLRIASCSWVGAPRQGAGGSGAGRLSAAGALAAEHHGYIIRHVAGGQSWQVDQFSH